MCSSGHKAGCFIRIRRSLCCLQLKIVKGKQRKDFPMPSSLNWRKTISTVRNSILSPQYSCPEEEKESSVITQTTDQDMWPSFSSSLLDAGPEKETVPKAYLKPAFLPAPCWLPGGGGLVKASHCCSQVWRLLRRLFSLSFLFFVWRTVSASTLRQERAVSFRCHMSARFPHRLWTHLS